MKKFLATAAIAAALLSTNANAGVGWNGIKVNGLNLNGLNLNGLKLNGTLWNGTSTGTQGGTVVGVTLPQ